MADPNWKIRAIARLNTDDIPDIVWQNDATGQLAEWLMSPTEQFEFHDLYRLADVPLGPGQVADVNWKIVGSGDFNRDGRVDLLWQHDGDGRIAVWILNGTTLVAGDLLSPGQVADLGWKIRALGDINGDDWPDLIWQHRATGDVSAWLMNGTKMVSGIVIGHVPDTNWQIIGPR